MTKRLWMSYEMMFESRLLEVRERIARAAKRSGRTSDDVTLVAVSKTFPSAVIREFLELNHVDFGENKVQEFLEKASDLVDSGINWHFIGHLQRNKAKEITRGVKLFHGLDSVRLGRELQKRLTADDTRLDCLLQVNVSNEDTKFGVPISGVAAALEQLAAFDRLRILGLMTLASPADNAEDVRHEFALLRTVSRAERVQPYLNSGLTPLLSMGMSHDFEVAIEEGATHVRIGSALFGSRDQYLPDDMSSDNAN